MSSSYTMRSGGPSEELAPRSTLPTASGAKDRALHQSETELIESQRLARIGSWHWDAKSDVVVGSDELLFYRIFGLDPSMRHLPAYREQRGRWYPVDDWKRLKAAIQSTGCRRVSATSWSFGPSGMGHRSGSPRAVRSSAISRNRIVGLRGTVQEITERKQAELALAERNLQLALAGKAELVGSYSYDVETGMMQISEGYATLHGLPEGTAQQTFSQWRKKSAQMILCYLTSITTIVRQSAQ